MPWPCSAEIGTGSPRPSRWNSSASVSRRGSSILFASRSTGFFAARRIAATSSSPGRDPGAARRRRTARGRPPRSPARAWSAIERVIGVSSAMSTPPVSTRRNSLAVPLADQLLAVARHARGLVHDGGARAGQPVDQRRLADVREADDRDRSEQARHRAGGTASAAAARARASGRASPRAAGARARSRRRPPGIPSRSGAAPRSRIGSPQATEAGWKLPGRQYCVPWIAAASTGTSSWSATIAAPGCAVAGNAAALPRPLDEEPERVRPRARPRASGGRLAVGLAAPHRERAEGADQLAEPGDAVRLDLGDVVDRARAERRRRSAGRSTRSG